MSLSNNCLVFLDSNLDLQKVRPTLPVLNMDPSFPATAVKLLAIQSTITRGTEDMEVATPTGDTTTDIAEAAAAGDRTTAWVAAEEDGRF